MAKLTNKQIVIAIILGFSYSLFLFKADKYTNIIEFFVMNGFAIIYLLIGLMLYYYGFKYWRIKRVIENIPTSKISSLAMGLVEISGTTEYGDSKLKSFYTNMDCVLYKTRLDKTCSDTPFFVKDSSGLILVNPRGGEFFLGEPYRTDEGIAEWLIKAGEAIYIIGTAQEKNNLKASITSELPVSKLFIGKGESDTVFIISNKSEQELSYDLSNKIVPSIFGGSIFSILSIIYILYVKTYQQRMNILGGILLIALLYLVYFIVSKLATNKRNI